MSLALLRGGKMNRVVIEPDSHDGQEKAAELEPDKLRVSAV